MRRIESVPVLSEGPRGCGHRKAKGIYLVAGNLMLQPCGRLPVPLTTCATCGGGIKPTRGMTWVSPRPLLANTFCENEPASDCRTCALASGNLPERAMLLWIGESFYPTPSDWIREGQRMGVSRKVNGIPKGFTIGQDWVLVAHRKAITAPCDNCVHPLFDPAKHCDACDGTRTIYTPAIFHAFRPQQIQYVCDGNESDAKLQSLEERGLTLVRVNPVDEPTTGSPVVPTEGVSK